MKKSGAKNYTDFLAGIIIFGIFAVGMIASLLAGAGAYRRLTERDAMSADARISTQYIANKVRSAGARENVLLPDDGGAGAVLELKDPETDGRYATYIYCRDGWIRELYTGTDREPDYDAGAKLIEVCGLDFYTDNNVLLAEVTTKDGEVHQLYLKLGDVPGKGAGA